jgi:hypothetical protein
MVRHLGLKTPRIIFRLSDLALIRSSKGIRASMAYVVDDLKTLKELSK